MEYSKAFSKVLKTYQQRILEEAEIMRTIPKKEGMKMRDQFLLAMGEETAIFLNTLIKAAKPKVILELGTSYGYSTLWLAEAANSYGGKLITLEINQEKSDYAKNMLIKANLEELVHFEVGDALEYLRTTANEFDLVLVDIWKDLYKPSFDLFYPKLTKSAWVISDNMVYPPHSKPEMDKYQRHLRSKGTFDSVLMPIGSGIEVSQLKNS